MKYLQHVLFTWLLAQGVHLLLWRFYFIERFGFDGEDGFLAFLAFLFTVPACLLCLLLLKTVVALKTHAIFRFIIWILCGALCLFITAFVIAALLGGASEFFRLMFALVPGCLSTALAILVRYKQFFRLLLQTRKSEHQHGQ